MLWMSGRREGIMAKIMGSDVNFENINPNFFNFNISDSINSLDSFSINSFSNFMDLGYYGNEVEKDLYELNYSLTYLI